MKMLAWDIETSFAVAGTFRCGRNLTLPYASIGEHSCIICASSSVVGTDKIATFALTDRPRASRTDDLNVCKDMRDAMDDADMLLHHNGDGFDVKVLNARLAYHGLKPAKPLKSVDTLKIARKGFRFPTNKLDDLGSYLGCGRKTDHPSGLWNRFSFGTDSDSDEAVRELAKYCAGDVVLLKAVYERLRPYCDPHIPGASSDRPVCPTCGSKDMVKRGITFSKTRKYQRYQCNQCGAYTRATRSEKGGSDYVRV